MPRISDAALASVVYLYSNRSDAETGKNTGGTGFLVGVPTGTPPLQVHHSYVVTNAHVAVRGGASVVRLNCNNGACDVVEFEPSDWEFILGQDVAAVPIRIEPTKHSATIVETGNFITKERINELNIGPGDDVIMIGRFVDHDGVITNKPAVRFGHISVMPAPIKGDDGWIESYCVDVHSRSGFSGSPVFAYRTDHFGLNSVVRLPGQAAQTIAALPTFFGLLGIHWGQFPEKWQLATGMVEAETGAARPLTIEGQYVRGVSGMTCVAPAWSILEVLNLPRLRQAREHDAALLAELHAAGEVQIVSNHEAG